MTFYFGGPSYLPSFSLSSSSSSTNRSNVDAQLINDASKIKAQQTLIGQNCANTNTLITEYFNQQVNVVIHGGSVPGHIVINRDWEATDRRLFNDYFADNPRYDEGMFHR